VRTELEQNEERLRALSEIPVKERTASEKREYNRLSTQKSRRKKRSAEIASNAETRREFWQENRQTLSEKELAEMEALTELVLDKLHWMETEHSVDPADECYVSLEDGTADIIQFIGENGVGRLGYIFSKDSEIRPDWSTAEYWRDPELLTKLCSEGYPMEIWVRYGFLVALPDWEVAEFLKTRAGWTNERINQLLGRLMTSEGHCVYPGAK